jgi:hypothetical protein
MCDCYAHKCLFCENKISIHIADYCTKRENIAVICPDCQAVGDYERSKTFYHNGKGLWIKKYERMYIDIIEDREQIRGKLKNNRYKGKPVIILSKDPKAYGVHLN